MKNTIYKITITNWKKYNENIKSGHKRILVSTGFLSDAKIRTLSPVTKLLYLSCLLVAGESTRSQIEVSHDSLVFQSGVKSGSLQSQLDQLQSLQLLTYEKIDPLINRIEKKRIEKKRSSSEVKTQEPADKDLNRKIWDSYKAAYLLRYKVEPVSNASVNSKISQLAKRLGAEAVDVINFYLTHNDSFYLKNLHSVGHCLANAESLRTQMLRGKAVTGKDVQEFEKQNSFAEQMNRMGGQNT